MLYCKNKLSVAKTDFPMTQARPYTVEGSAEWQPITTKNYT